MPITLIQRFLKLEAAGGIILFLMAILSIVWANSPLVYLHTQFLDKSLSLINEGLMVIFFLLVGLELKRGYLATQQKGNEFLHFALPLIAAIGGMVFPILIYYVINSSSPETLRGWATPCATDIAFALGLLSLFGKRVPDTLKLFLLTLAIFDDLGAIIIIGIFYSEHISPVYLFSSALIFNLLVLINIAGARSLIPYITLGVVLWFCLLKSGVHPTIAGVLVALTVPDGKAQGASPLRKLEDALHPWVTFFIMPLFALANAGFSFQGISGGSFSNVMVIGIVMGLFFGKQIGIFGSVWLMVKLKLANLPKNCSLLMMYGLSLICGIGFTMSLFLGTLSFQSEDIYLVLVRLGVIIGSLLSGLIGSAVLWGAFSKYKSGGYR